MDRSFKLSNIVSQSHSGKTFRIGRVSIAGLVGQYDRNLHSLIFKAAIALFCRFLINDPKTGGG